MDVIDVALKELGMLRELINRRLDCFEHSLSPFVAEVNKTTSFRLFCLSLTELHGPAARLA